MPHSERRRCGRIAVLGRLAHQHTALASGLMDLRPPFSTATTLVGVACKRAERRCARPRRAPSNWPMVDVLGGIRHRRGPKAKLTAAPPPVDRTCARHRTSLRCGCHFHLVPRGSTLSARPLHGPLPRHHTQLRRSREMSDELRCCVRTRVGGCSRCMACALATSISQRFRHSGTEHSELSGDLGHTVTITSYMLHRAPGRHVAGGHWVVGGGILLPTAPVAPSFNPLAPQSVARGPLTGRRALNLP